MQNKDTKEATDACMSCEASLTGKYTVCREAGLCRVCMQAIFDKSVMDDVKTGKAVKIDNDEEDESEDDYDACKSQLLNAQKENTVRAETEPSSCPGTVGDQAEPNSVVGNIGEPCACGCGKDASGSHHSCGCCHKKAFVFCLVEENEEGFGSVGTCVKCASNVAKTSNSVKGGSNSVVQRSSDVETELSIANKLLSADATDTTYNDKDTKNKQLNSAQRDSVEGSKSCSTAITIGTDLTTDKTGISTTTARKNNSDDNKARNTADGDKSATSSRVDTTTVIPKETDPPVRSTNQSSVPYLFEGSPATVATNGLFKQVHTIYVIAEEAINKHKSNRTMYTSDIMRREVMTKYIPLSGVSFTPIKQKDKYREHSVPSKLVPTGKIGPVSYLLGLWRTKCHSSPICPVVYHTETNEIKLMNAISDLKPFVAHPLEEDDNLDEGFKKYNELYDSKMWKPEGHINPKNGKYVNSLRDWNQRTVDEPDKSDPGYDLWLLIKNDDTAMADIDAKRAALIAQCTEEYENNTSTRTKRGRNKNMNTVKDDDVIATDKKRLRRSTNKDKSENESRAKPVGKKRTTASEPPTNKPKRVASGIVEVSDTDDAVDYVKPVAEARKRRKEDATQAVENNSQSASLSDIDKFMDAIKKSNEAAEKSAAAAEKLAAALTEAEKREAKLLQQNKRYEEELKQMSGLVAAASAKAENTTLKKSPPVSPIKPGCSLNKPGKNLFQSQKSCPAVEEQESYEGLGDVGPDSDHNVYAAMAFGAEYGRIIQENLDLCAELKQFKTHSMISSFLAKAKQVFRKSS